MPSAASFVKMNTAVNQNGVSENGMCNVISIVPIIALWHETGGTLDCGSAVVVVMMD